VILTENCRDFPHFLQADSERVWAATSCSPVGGTNLNTEVIREIIIQPVVYIYIYVCIYMCIYIYAILGTSPKGKNSVTATTIPRGTKTMEFRVRPY
jgi:hypothetical protein